MQSLTILRGSDSGQQTIIDRAYVLGSSLGEGGMGTVFRATQLLDGQDVALKLIARPHDQQSKSPTNASQLEANVNFRLLLAREFQMLASLHHPNVIRVLNYGFDDLYGPYYTMEVLADPQTILQAGRDLPVAQQVELVAQLLRALLYVHRRNILHRDIKPSNVLVVDGEVKLLDFGISAALGNTDEIAGTAEYMAPELFEGGALTPTSDLYAVGLVLHQLLTGNLPRSQTSSFLADLFSDSDEEEHDSRTLGLVTAPPIGDTTQQTNGLSELTGATSPDMPSDPPDGGELNVLVEGALGDVVRRMLRRRPEERYQSADEVLRALEAAIGATIPLETAETRESFLQAAVLVGRNEELRILRNALDDLRHAKGGAILIGGESGVGKSRLISELRTLASVYRCWIVDGQCITEASGIQQEWLPLLHMLCVRGEIQDQEASTFKPFVSDIVTRLGRPIPDLPNAKPEELHSHLATSLQAVFKRLARPLVFLVEDLQWAGTESLRLLTTLSKNAAGVPVLLIGTYRSDEAPKLSEQLPSFVHMPLRRLGVEAIAELSQSMLGPIGRSPNIVEYLIRQTEGNVFFLVEILRAMGEHAGELQRITDTSLPEEILTLGIERIVRRRVEQLPLEYHPVLELAATLGRKLDLAVIEHAFPSLSLRSLLLQGANAAVLESQGMTWRFAHDKLRESILRRLDAPAQQALNLQAADAIEATYTGEAREEHATQLALHLHRAGKPERAWVYDKTAAEHAERLGVLSDSRTHYRAALEALAALPASVELRRERIDLMLRLMQTSLLADGLEVQIRRRDDAATLLAELNDTAGATRSDKLRQARLDLLTGRAFYYANKLRDAIGYFQRVLPIGRELEDAELLALPSAVIGQATVFQEHPKIALTLLEPAIPLLQQQKNEAEAQRSQIFVALALAQLGRYHEAIQIFGTVIRSAKERNQPQMLTATVLQQGVAMLSGMDWDGILRMTGPVGAHLLRAGEKAYAALAFTMQAVAYAQLGNHNKARELDTQVHELDQELRGVLAFELRSAHLSEVPFCAGNYDEALQRARRALELSAPSSLARTEGISQRVIALSLSRLGSPLDVVVPHLERSHAALMSRGCILDAAQTELAWGDVHQSSGDRAQAKQLYEQAAARFRAAGCDHLEPLLGEKLASVSSP